MKPITPANQTDMWLATAAYGAKLAYHYGYLVADRDANPDLHHVATRLAFAEARGLVTLTQMRVKYLGDDKAEQWLYIATRTGVKE